MLPLHFRILPKKHVKEDCIELIKNDWIQFTKRLHWIKTKTIALNQ